MRSSKKTRRLNHKLIRFGESENLYPRARANSPRNFWPPILRRVVRRWIIRLLPSGGASVDKTAITRGRESHNLLGEDAFPY